MPPWAESLGGLFQGLGQGLQTGRQNAVAERQQQRLEQIQKAQAGLHLIQGFNALLDAPPNLSAPLWEAFIKSTGQDPKDPNVQLLGKTFGKLDPEQREAMKSYIASIGGENPDQIVDFVSGLTRNPATMLKLLGEVSSHAQTRKAQDIQSGAFLGNEQPQVPQAPTPTGAPTTFGQLMGGGGVAGVNMSAPGLPDLAQGQAPGAPTAAPAPTTTAPQPPIDPKAFLQRSIQTLEQQMDVVAQRRQQIVKNIVDPKARKQAEDSLNSIEDNLRQRATQLNSRLSQMMSEDRDVEQRRQFETAEKRREKQADLGIDVRQQQVELSKMRLDLERDRQELLKMQTERIPIADRRELDNLRQANILTGNLARAHAEVFATQGTKLSDTIRSTIIQNSKANTMSQVMAIDADKLSNRNERQLAAEYNNVIANLYLLTAERQLSENEGLRNLKSYNLAVTPAQFQANVATRQHSYQSKFVQKGRGLKAQKYDLGGYEDISPLGGTTGGAPGGAAQKDDPLGLR